jgi:uncharacterized protein
VDVGVVDLPDRSRFEVRVDGETAGFTAYHRRPGVIAFMHTEIYPRLEIYPRFEGGGLGSQLVQTALSHARSEGASVLPFCPFVRSYIAEHSEYLDLVPSEVRPRFQLTGHV